MACYVMVVSNARTPATAAPRPGGMDDERTAAVDEPRDQQPHTDSPPAGIARLSPLQKAWAAYKRHTGDCMRCRTSDGGRCEDAVRLWQAHRDLCDEAYRRLSS